MDLAGLCLEYVTGQSTTESPRLIAKGISGGQVELVKVVEVLGIYLTSTNVDNRCSGTRLLSEVLTQLNPGSLNSDEVQYIIAFYCDRLKDKSIILPHVLTGIYALVTQYTLKDSDVVNVCRTIFKEVYNQSQQFPERRLVYAIFNHFLSHHLKAVQLMSSEFVLGYIQAMDGERDPRNLLTVFHSVQLIVSHLQFDPLAEDLFEVTSCYFPIDFTPPPNDPLAVSKESLVLALRQCLTATDKFAEFCLPLLLDKLTSDITSAKLDSLSTLTAGACVYGAAKLHPFLQPFWTAIKREMFQSADEAIQIACVNALTALARALSQPLQLSSSDNILDSFVAMVIKDCGRHLNEPELRLITPTIHLLKGIAVASDPACTSVASSVLPSLIQQVSLESQTLKQKIVLEALLVFISAMRQSANGEASTPLLSNRDALLKLLTSASSHEESSVRVVAITTLGVLLQIHGAMDKSKSVQLCQELKEIALSDQEVSVREASCKSLALFASVDADVVKDHLLPNLLSLLSESTADVAIQLHLVKLLSSLCVVHSTLLELSVPALVERFCRVLRSDTQLASAIASALVTVTQTCVSWENYQRLLSNGLLQQLVAECVMSCDIIASVLESIVAILSLFTQSSDDSSCQRLLGWVIAVLGGEVPISETTSPLPGLTSNAPTTQTQLIALLTGVLGSSSKSVVERFSDHLLPFLSELSLNCEHETSCQHAAKCYASLINKLPQDNVLSFLEPQLLEMWRVLSSTEPLPTRRRVLNLWVWLSKALLMRGHPTGMETVVKLLSICSSDSDLGTDVADSFQVMLSDDEHVLNLRCRSNVRLFYKQHLFMQVVPKIVELFKSRPTGECRQDNLLRALSHLMQGVPKEVLLAELLTVLPLLLESMKSEDVGLKLSTLDALHSLISDAPQSVVEHVPALVPRLLNLARDQASMKVRIASLSCIGSLTSLPTHTVYPYQSTIIHQLGACLDDHKRLVRKEAVDARSKWYLLGTLD